MLTGMNELNSGRPGRILWALAAVLLLLVWFASISLDDDRLCSSVPLSFGYAAVVLLGIAGMVAGARLPRPTLTCLFGLAAGLYFLLRCLSGDILSEIWRELPLILAAFVCYGAGFLMAQRQGGRALTVALALGVLGNVAFLFLLREQLVPLEATGRPAMSLAGANTPRCALFTYPNFVAMFLMVAGAVLVFRPFWTGWRSWVSLLSVAVGILGLVCSFLCDSRAVYGLPPVLLLIAWVLWAIIRLYSSKNVGWGLVLSGIALFVGIGVLLGEFLIGDSLLRELLAVDTHGRTGLWGTILHLLPQVPWYGHGAGATQWQLLPVIKAHGMPNYAHNDYLQAWMDYGIVGLGLMLAVLLSHLSAGFWSLASEDIDRRRRALVAASMFILLAFAGCAVFDFVWHHAALVGLSAFACGALASPIPCRPEPLFRRRKWAAGYRPSLRPVRYLGKVGTALCCVVCTFLAAGCAFFGWRLLPAWKAQWEYNALWHARVPQEERAEFLERVMEFYPDPELVDHYVTLSPPAGREDNVARREGMMRRALETNPHQLYTVLMLVDLLGREGRPEEAEALMRDHFRPGGQDKTGLANWPAYYGRNLLMWGRLCMEQGDHGSALSMMEYALNIWGHVGDFRVPERVAKVGRARNKAMNVYLAARRVDVDMLRAVGVQKDDSWKQPLRPGGQPALYERWGNEPHSRKFANPYGKRSPFNLPKK